MDLFPAIDLRGGRAVRLYQGDYDRMTVYNADPAAQARAFAAAGAKFLHVVDLDGAKDGTAENFETIRAIAAGTDLYLEVGGGIRDEARIRAYLELGVDRCILGTAAVKDFDFAARMAQKYGPKIAVGVDMKDGFVAVAGWREVTPEPGLAFCRRCAAAACRPSSRPISRATAHCRAPTSNSTARCSRSPPARDGFRRHRRARGARGTGRHGLPRGDFGQSIYTGAIDLPRPCAAAKAEREGRR